MTPSVWGSICERQRPLPRGLRKRWARFSRLSGMAVTFALVGSNPQPAGLSQVQRKVHASSRTFVLTGCTAMASFSTALDMLPALAAT